jgi:uncharacterized protein involved in exopolysaccharide biosynthesis
MNNPTHKQQPIHEDAIDLFALLATLYRRRVLIIAITGTFAVGSVALAFLLTPIFRAEVVVKEVDSGGGRASALIGQFGGLASMAGINLGGLGGGSPSGVAVLQSRALVSELIVRNNLLPVLYADRWDAAGKRWAVEPEEQPSVWLGTRYFMEEVATVRPDPTTGLITVTVEWEDPELAARWANGLVDLANETIRARAIQSSRRNLEFLTAEIGSTAVVGLQQALYELIEAETKTLMLADGRPDFAFQTIDPAVVPEMRARPNRPQIAVLGTLLGAVLAVGVVAFLEALDRHRRGAAGR